MKDITTEEINCVEDILHADVGRRERNGREFNPVTGKNSIGKRFPLSLPDFILPRQLLPESMRGEQLVKRLMEAGCFYGACLEGETPERLMADFLRLRMLHDFPFWAATAVSIKRKGGGGDISFELNRPQRKLVECFEKMRLAGRPIRVVLLKARQWGGSTCVQLYMAWLQLMHSVGLNSLIIAHQKAGTDEIKDMFDRMLEAYPPELLAAPGQPAIVKKTENVGRGDAAMRVISRNCKIKLGTAERPDSCRGGDYNLVHLSEVGLWHDTQGRSAEDIVRSACGGVLLAPLTMIVYESTANGTGNFFHREYLSAMRGESQFAPLFVAWFEIDQYSVALTGRERRELAGRLWKRRHDAASSDRTECGAYLWSLFEKGATLDAIAWYELERRKYNDHARMASEYPSDEQEAFAHSGSIVFNRADILAMRSGCRAPERRGEIESSSADPESLRDLRFIDMEEGGLAVWRLPEGKPKIADRYLAVVDVGGRTARADWSVVTVFDRAGMLNGEGAEIAAQWRGHCDLDQLAWRAARIARFYGEALLVIESNSIESREAAREVDGCELPFILHQIRDAYPNIYARRSGIENLRVTQDLKLGFHTNAATKPMVVATLIRAVREGLYKERCDEALNEMECYERRPNGSYGAIAGCHDDILMTRAIGMHISLYEMDPPRLLAGSPRQGHSSGRRRLRPLNEASF